MFNIPLIMSVNALVNSLWQLLFSLFSQKIHRIPKSSSAASFSKFSSAVFPHGVLRSKIFCAPYITTLPFKDIVTSASYSKECAFWLLMFSCRPQTCPLTKFSSNCHKERSSSQSSVQAYYGSIECFLHSQWFFLNEAAQSLNLVRSRSCAKSTR